MVGHKHDSNKPRPELLPSAAITIVSQVLAYGAVKYAPHNWRNNLAWSRLLGAALRHLFAWQGGERDDPESGLPHLAHAVCCVLFLLDLEIYGIGPDDRWRKPE